MLNALTKIFDSWVDFGDFVSQKLLKFGIVGGVITVILMIPWLVVCAIILSMAGLCTLAKSRFGKPKPPKCEVIWIRKDY